MLNVSFSRSKENQNVIFWLQTFFKTWRRKSSNSKSNALYFFSIQNLTRCKNFKSKSDALYFFKFKIWRGVIFKIQNKTRCISLSSKSDALLFFKSKICHVKKISFQNHAF